MEQLTTEASLVLGGEPCSEESKELSTRKLTGFDFELNEPPSKDGFIATVRLIEERFLCKLPESYVEFMTASDGGRGSIGEQYLVLWRVSEILEHDDQEAEDILYLPFGDNGSGECFAFIRDETMRIVVIPFMAPRRENAILVADTFNSLFDELSSGHFWVRLAHLGEPYRS